MGGCIQFFLLNWGHVVDICTEGLGSQCEFDGMVPLLSLWQVVEGCFQKYVSKAVVHFWNHPL